MNAHFEDSRLFLDRTPEEIGDLVKRLNRIEGQVRGIRAMIEAGRHCRDELQQINAAGAALREVSGIIASQHIEAGLAFVVDDRNRPEAMADLLDVLQAAMRRT